MSARDGGPVRIVHLSDIHMTGEGRRLFGAVDPAAKLSALLEAVRADRVAPCAIVVTGDLADEGEPDAYRRLRELIAPVAEELGAELVWVCGNHDARELVHRELGNADGGGIVGTSVREVDGVRLVALDSSVPGRHHGRIGSEQLEWLAALLAAPAPRGTVVALHHPPIPSPIRMFDAIGLRDANRLADVVEGSDVRLILAGHFHHASSGLLRGIPVVVAGATCFAQDPTVAGTGARAVDDGQSYNLIELSADHVVVSVAAARRSDAIHTWSEESVARLRYDEDAADTTERTP